jgi:hypothetical protein
LLVAGHDRKSIMTRFCSVPQMLKLSRLNNPESDCACNNPAYCVD